MAVDKLAPAIPGLVSLLLGRASLEKILAQFDEAVSSQNPAVVRRRLKKKVKDIKVSLENQEEIV